MLTSCGVRGPCGGRRGRGACANGPCLPSGQASRRCWRSPSLARCVVTTPPWRLARRLSRKICFQQIRLAVDLIFADAVAGGTNQRLAIGNQRSVSCNQGVSAGTQRAIRPRVGVLANTPVESHLQQTVLLGNCGLGSRFAASCSVGYG